MKRWKSFWEKIRNSENFIDLKSSNVRDILNGNILTSRFIRKQYMLILMLVVLSIFYIDNRYTSEKQIKQVAELKRQIQDAKYESLTISAELVEISRQSNVYKLLQERGIPVKPGNSPAIVIEEIE